MVTSVLPTPQLLESDFERLRTLARVSLAVSSSLDTGRVLQRTRRIHAHGRSMAPLARRPRHRAHDAVAFSDEDARAVADLLTRPLGSPGPARASRRGATSSSTVPDIVGAHPTWRRTRSARRLSGDAAADPDPHVARRRPGRAHGTHRLTARDPPDRGEGTVKAMQSSGAVLWDPDARAPGHDRGPPPPRPSRSGRVCYRRAG